LTAIKLAVLGGSSVATPLLIQALLNRPDRPEMDVVLLGRTAAKLDPVAALSARLADGAAPALRVTHSTEAERGLEGAHYVLNQVRVGGYAARSYDESFPHRYGIPGEETFGPGGMNNALRTVPVVLEYCRMIERLAPGALLVNLTNPSSFIQYAVTQYSQVQVVGVCDSPVALAEGVAALLEVPRQELWIGYVGMHHFGWVTEVRRGDRDMLPELLERIERFPGLPVEPDIVRAVGAVPTSYYKYYYHPERMLEKQRGAQTRAGQLIELESRILSDLGSGELQALPESLQARGAHWYDGIVVPVLLAHAADAHSTFILNVTNRTTLPWMPPQAVVELPVLVQRDGFHPLTPPSAPPDVQAMLRVNAAFEMLWVEAVVERSYDKALRAMALNHLVRDLDQARAILGEIWK
jgi:6-phospho-beta-glucosidase